MPDPDGRHGRLVSFTRFRDYDENLTSAKVVPVTDTFRISQPPSGGERVFPPRQAEARGRMASEIAFPSLPCVKRATLRSRNSHVSRVKKKNVSRRVVLVKQRRKR